MPLYGGRIHTETTFALEIRDSIFSVRKIFLNSYIKIYTSNYIKHIAKINLCSTRIAYNTNEVNTDIFHLIYIYIYIQQ